MAVRSAAFIGDPVGAQVAFFEDVERQAARAGGGAGGGVDGAGGSGNGEDGELARDGPEWGGGGGVGGAGGGGGGGGGGRPGGAGAARGGGGCGAAYDAGARGDNARWRGPEGKSRAALLLGWLADGPSRGARIYADRDGNGSPSANEDTGLTSNRYGLLALSPADASAPVIATGGLDTFTSQPNQMVLQAPAGAVVVNPLTTLVQALVHQDGMTVAAAASAVAQALNLTLSLPAGFDLTNFDPLQTSANEGLPVQIAAVQVASLVTLGADSAAQRLALTAALADAIANAGTAPIDLGDETFLSTLLAQVWPAGEDVSALANHVSTAVIIIGTAGDQNTLNVAQTWALDLYAPGQPSLALVLPPLPSAQGDDPYTRIFIDLPALDAMDGSAPAVGDTLHILIGADEARAVSLSLNSDDLDAGYVTARLYPTRYSYGESLGVWLQDRWGHQGAITDWKALDIYQSAQSFDNLVLEHLNSGILDFVPDQMQGLHEDLSQARQSLLAQHPGLIGMGYAIGNDLLSSIVLG